MTKLEIDTEQMISVQDAAAQLNISIATAWRWVRDGKLKTVKLPRQTLVHKSALANIKTDLDTKANS